MNKNEKKKFISFGFACAISFCRPLPSLGVRPLERSLERSTSENPRRIQGITQMAIVADLEHFTECNRCNQGFRTSRRSETELRHDILARANGHRMVEGIIGKIVLHRVLSTKCVHIFYLNDIGLLSQSWDSCLVTACTSIHPRLCYRCSTLALVH